MGTEKLVFGAICMFAFSSLYKTSSCPFLVISAEKATWLIYVFDHFVD